MTFLRNRGRDVNEPIERTPPLRVPSCAVARILSLPSGFFLSREPRSLARFINARRAARGDMRESQSYSPRERHARGKYYILCICTQWRARLMKNIRIERAVF